MLMPAKRGASDTTAASKRQHCDMTSPLEDKTNLITQITTLKTRRAAQEITNYAVEDKLVELRRQADLLTSQIVELDSHEADSMATIDNNFAVSARQLRLDFDEKLLQLKERVTSEVESSMVENLRRLETRKRDLVRANEQLRHDIAAHKSDTNRSLIKLKEDLHRKRLVMYEQMDQTLATLQGDIDDIDASIEATGATRQHLEAQLAGPLARARADIEGRLKSVQEKSATEHEELARLSRRIEERKAEAERLRRAASEKAAQIDEFAGQVRSMEEHLTASEFTRRKLHNRLQELKGNIRVFCRVRPASGLLVQLQCPDNELNDEANQDIVISRDNKKLKFSFDKVFAPSATNEHIFEEISHLIQSSLDGFNVCVFAYGQTGSGKTWTMSHPELGMIPLSINQIFTTVADLKAKGWTYELEAQVLEIYNDTIVDLLGLLGKYEIKHDDAAGTTLITNTKVARISDAASAQALFNTAQRRRATASTMANERSSRSHSVFILRIRGTHLLGTTSSGVLNLVDLAGSERLNTSQARGDRLKETQAINKSLSCLGDVIYSLNQKNNHIPYRNSKLTYLLKHSLGGDLKTLMFVNVSPLEQNINETINSLRFASKVNKVALKNE